VSIPFLDSKQEPPLNALGLALKEMKGQYKAAVEYGAHMNALLREACTILEGLDVTVDVSEPLAFWWEKEKRKKAGQTSLVGVDGKKLVVETGPLDGKAGVNETGS